tara:strand:+ start:2377 stop:3258 length:882 start_codon:yes stop_codon:yes gene_type:complete
MSRGFITIGIDTDEDKVKYCYALALSIKQCDPDSEICIVVDQNKSDYVPKEYLHAFDYITELPFGNSAFVDGFHGMNIWQLAHCTPFEETIYVDSDTIFNNVDIELLWDSLQDYEIAIPAKALTFRNNACNKFTKFNIENHYGMPALYNNFIYFKSGKPQTLAWFKMADAIFQNWRELYYKMFKEIKPTTFNKNILANTVTYLLDMENDVSTVAVHNLYDLDIHSQWLWDNDLPESWTQMLNFWYADDSHLMIENFTIPGGIIHYKDKQFLTKELMDVLKNHVKVNSTRKTAA